MLLSKTFITAIGFASAAYAWGGLGHKTVANVALQFLRKDALAKVEVILAADGHKKTANPSIADVAMWAEEYGGTREGSFSKSYHHIDAIDDPPFECNVDLQRDCSGTECLVTAITNHTEQLLKPGMSADDTAKALKFLVHLLGDATQPLHNEGQARGGNDIRVRWNGQSKNFHTVWDTDMITKFAGHDNETNRDTWTTTIVNEIINGSYKDLVPSWLNCTDIHDALNCALQWSIDSNQIVCNYVLRTDPAGKELNGTYYQGASPIIQEQIAKGGVRLAVWLNQHFGTGEAGRLPLAKNRLVVQDTSLQ